MSGKGKSLPPALKTMLAKPLYPARPSALRPGVTIPAGRAAGPTSAPAPHALLDALRKVKQDAEGRGVGWGEWLSIATATMVTLNSPSSLATLHRFATGSGTFQSDPSGLPALNLQQRLDRALLMREVGLKCIGFVGIPKVINNLAALRKAVDEDKELASALPTAPRRKIGEGDVANVQRAAYTLWDDIYQPHSDKLIKILGHSHPDLPVFILDGEYGPLFSPPHTFRPSEAEPEWEVGRLRTSLVAVAALRAQGGVGPQVTSHIWGLMKAETSIPSGHANEKGLRWLTSEEGAEWVVEAVNGLSEVVEGGEVREDSRDSKL
ncbi:unnamed protein product [Parajaminaea phylloscopi]